MKGFIKQSVLAAVLVFGLTASANCQDCVQRHYYRWVDPCWPERYTAMAIDEVNEPFSAQVYNGHVLDQTVWNWFFEAGTDKLTPGGQYELAIRARRRPHPDCKLYLQTAQDVHYDPAAPDKMVTARAKLDSDRVASVLRYLGAQTAARPVAWDVTIHDPGEVGMSAIGMQTSIIQRNGSYQGVMSGTGGGSSGGSFATSAVPAGGGAGAGAGASGSAGRVGP